MTTRRARASHTTSATERVTAQERFDRRVHARRRRAWSVTGALVLLAIILGGAWWVLWRSDWLLVEAVVVQGVEPQWEGDILATADIGLSQPMVEVDTQSVKSAVAGLNVVKDVEVRRSWPATITVEVTPREAVIAVREVGGVALVDEEGVTVEVVQDAPDGVPVVTAQGSSGTTPEAYRAAWAVLSALPDSLASQVTAVTVSSADLLTLELGERTVVWGGPQDPDLKRQVVEALLASGATHVDVSAPRNPVTRTP